MGAMATIRVTRSEAARYTRMAQTGSVVLLVGAVAAYPLLPVGGRVAVAPPVIEEEEPDAAADAAPAIDFAAVTEAMSIWDVKKAEPETAAGPQDEVPDAVATGDEADVRYLGAIKEPGRLVAIVSADGGQHLVAPGAQLAGSDMKVMEVTADEIVVSDGRGRRSIPLAAKTSAVLGTTSTGSSGMLADPNGQIEMDADMMEQRAMDRRGLTGKRPAAPGARTPSRPTRPNSGPTPGRTRTSPEGT
jgi:hypothetical protein